MGHSSDNASAKTLTSPVAITLSMKQHEILEEWVREVKLQITPATELRDPIIINTIPVFLGNLAEALDGRLARDNANDSNNIAEEHGGERARITDYSPDQIVLEYVLLREIVVKTLTKFHKNEVDMHLCSVIQKSFDEAIQKAMMAFYLIFNEIRENIVVHLTHDMRTPLTAAKLSLDIILKKLAKTTAEEPATGIKNLVDRVNKNLDYTNELIQGMLDEKYLHSYKVDQENRFKAANLMEIALTALDDLSEDILKNIALTGEQIEGFWDKKALRRVVENLVSNAVKYGDDDTLIEIKIHATLGRALLSVHNMGRPIPVEERELLFNTFQRTDSSIKGTKKGWGLGLAYCREVAEAHAGSLGIESSLENGTTFTIDIPIDPRGIKIKCAKKF